jgi:predicted ATPase/DNA-binding winged helix-turn-helix (wHTH) protein
MKYFAPYRFDESERMLWRDQDLLPLTRKAGDLLACLMRAQGKWVDKSSILSSVWPDTHVHPDNIKVLIHEIRHALRDDARNPRFIRSESGRGYAFIAGTTEYTPQALPDAREGLPHFVIRVPELAAMGEAVDTARAGQSVTVLVTGEHGCGKTALCDIFVRAVAAAVPMRAVFGRCSNHDGDRHPVQPFIDALHQLAARHPSLVWRALADHAPSLLAQIPELQSRAPAAAQPAVPLHRQLSDVLKALTREVPLILVIEDLQWGNDATVAAFAALAQECGSGKWLLIGTTCQHDGTRAAASISRLTAIMRTAPSCVVLELGSLTVDQITRYVDARFGRGCLTDFAPFLHEVTGGNPRLMTTAVDGLVSRGLIRYTAEQWRCDSPRDVLAGAVPEVLHELFVQEIDRLAADERGVLEAACAVGLEFTSSAVAIAGDFDVGRVKRVLDPLASRGRVIRSSTSPRQSGRAATYRFRHALYAEIVADRTPIAQHLRSASRLACVEERRARRA